VAHLARLAALTEKAGARMTRALQPGERDEIDALAFECEQSPARLRRYLLELVRLRNVMRVVRSRARVSPSVAASIALNLPPRSTASEWCRLAGIEGAPDLVGDGLPEERQPELDLHS